MKEDNHEKPYSVRFHNTKCPEQAEAESRWVAARDLREKAGEWLPMGTHFVLGWWKYPKVDHDIW